MSDHAPQNQRFTVSIYDPDEASRVLTFIFVPAGLSQHNGRVIAPRRVPQFIVKARPEAGGFEFDWTDSPDDPGAAKIEIEAEILARLTDRTIWIKRVNSLVELFEQWAIELHWSTRRIDKKRDDARIGMHHVPALLMQEETCRILLEPVGRSAPGAEGVVDLYLMPAYDDIATLYFYGDRWNLHYVSSGAPAVATVRESTALSLTKETLERVLAEMRQNAV